jgi:hypothetical protein
MRSEYLQQALDLRTFLKAAGHLASSRGVVQEGVSLPVRRRDDAAVKRELAVFSQHI